MVISIIPPFWRATKDFSRHGDFMELWLFEKHFIKIRKFFLEFFILDTVKTTFWMKHLTQ